MSQTSPKNTTNAPDIRTRILGAATHLFASGGFDGTPLQAIADDVDIAKASLLYHYPSKNELRGAVLDQVMSHWNDVLPRLLEAATSGERRFESLIDEVVVFFTQDTDRARLLVREMLDRPVQMERLFGQYLGPWMTILSDYIRRGQQEEVIYAEVDPEAYILQTIQLVVGTLAIGDVVDDLLDASGGAESAHHRQIAEMVRMARCSLFVEPADADQSIHRTSHNVSAERNPDG